MGLADRRTSGPQFAPHIPVLVDTDFSVDYLEKICCVRQMRVRASVINVPVKRPLYSAIDVVASAERGCSKQLSENIDGLLFGAVIKNNNSNNL